MTAAVMSTGLICASSSDSPASAGVAGFGRVGIMRDSAVPSVRQESQSDGITSALGAGEPPVGRGTATPGAREMGPGPDVCKTKKNGPRSETPGIWMTISA